jgi:hypothetical protein
VTETVKLSDNKPHKDDESRFEAAYQKANETARNQTSTSCSAGCETRKTGRPDRK